MFKILTSKITAVILILLAVWLLRGALSIAVQKFAAETALKSASSKLEALKEEHIALEETLTNLRDPVYLEREVRTKLNFKAIGEKVAFVYHDVVQEKTASGSFQEELNELEKIKNWLYNLLHR